VLALRLPFAFLCRDLRIELSYKVGFALQLLGGLLAVVTFYFVALVFASGGSSMLESGGVDYFSFAVVGLAFSAYLSEGIAGLASSLRESKVRGTLELIVLSPARTSGTLVAAALPSYLLGLVTVVTTLAAGAAFGASFDLSSIGAALIGLLLTTASFVGLSLLAAAPIPVTERGNPIAWVIRVASALLAGVVYPVSVLPGPLQTIAEAIPLTHALDVMRGTLLEGAGLAQVWPDLLALLVLTAVLLPLGLFACRLGINAARTDGSLRL
jgi:ABC-2 type transport system permease protein